MHDDDIPELLSEDDLRAMLAVRRQSLKPRSGPRKLVETKGALYGWVWRWRRFVAMYDARGDRKSAALARRILKQHERRLAKWKRERRRAMLGGKQEG